MTDSKQIPPFGLRLPPDLKERIQSAAAANHRSMNAEIVDRLARSFGEVDAIIAEMRVQMSEAIDNMNKAVAAARVELGLDKK